MKYILIFLFSILTNTFAYNFVGDATYYGGAGKGGSCTSSYVPSGFTTVAINSPQYDNGLACGSCLEGVITINSQKKYFKAIVDNVCPECLFGSLDIGEPGDGRWKVEWSFINCPPANLIISTQGSNSYYGKIKIEAGGRINYVNINNMSASPSYDGFWIVNDSTGSLGCGANTNITFQDGTKKKICINGKLFGGYCNKTNICNTTINNPTSTPTTAKPTTPKPTSTTNCQAKWDQCGGINWTGKTCCITGSKCTYVNDWYSQCL